MIITMIAATLAALPAINESRFLDCIAQVEGHKWEDPGGAYGIQPGTWRQHSRLPFRFASSKYTAGVIASKHLAWLSKSLLADGYAVTPYNLAGCWRWGFEGFKRRNAMGSIEYAERVKNLYECAEKI